MFGWGRPQLSTSEQLRREYDALPPIAACDKSKRLELLERLVVELTKENNMMRRGSQASSQFPPSAPAPRCQRSLSSSVPSPIAFAVKGSLFSHVESIQTTVGAQCGVQWLRSDNYPNGEDITAKARVLFFRTGQRVSPTELADIEAFCKGTANFVVFMHNEMRESHCNSVGVEKYVTDQISSFGHTTQAASIAFKEDALYPTGDGLNASSLAMLISFVTAQVPRAIY